MAYSLSAAEQDFYAQQGYLVRPAVFSPDETQALIDAAERASSKAMTLVDGGKTYILDGKRFVDAGSVTLQFEHQPGTDTLRVIEPVDGLDARLAELVDDPRLTDPMRQIIGQQQLALWTNKLNLKRPREGSGFGWHQDSPYWIHDSGHVDLLPNVMCAFDAADETNGCLRVIPGSHRRGCLPGTDDGTLLGGFFTSPAEFDLNDQVLVVVPPGSLIFFSPHLIHGSLPNTSDEPRRAIILTYQPANHAMLKTGLVRNIQS